MTGTIYYYQQESRVALTVEGDADCSVSLKFLRILSVLYFCS